MPDREWRGLAIDDLDGIYLEVTRGFLVPPSPRGVDYLVAARAGRISGNRVADTIDSILLEGYVRGSTPAAWLVKRQALLATLGEGVKASLAVSAAADDIFDTVAPHGFVVGESVVLGDLAGGAGLVAGQVYYVIAGSYGASTFKLSATPGGAAVNFTTNVTAGTVRRAPGRLVVTGEDYGLPTGVTAAINCRVKNWVEGAIIAYRDQTLSVELTSIDPEWVLTGP